MCRPARAHRCSFTGKAMAPLTAFAWRFCEALVVEKWNDRKDWNDEIDFIGSAEISTHELFSWYHIGGGSTYDVASNSQATEILSWASHRRVIHSGHTGRSYEAAAKNILYPKVWLGVLGTFETSFGDVWTSTCFGDVWRRCTVFGSFNATWGRRLLKRFTWVGSHRCPERISPTAATLRRTKNMNHLSLGATTLGLLSGFGSYDSCVKLQWNWPSRHRIMRKHLQEKHCGDIWWNWKDLFLAFLA